MENAGNISVAIIGAGFISEYHVNGIRAADSAEVSALVGRSQEKTAARAGELSIPRFTIEPQDVFSDPGIDAIVIATPDATHKSLAVSALRSGKSILVQKPMAMNSGECREILEAAENSRGHLSVSFMHRYFPEIRWLREQLRTEEFGPVHSVRIRNATPGAGWSEWFYDPEMVAGGVVMQLGVHGIDLLQYLFGPISSVIALSATMKPHCRLQDGREAQMRLEDNVVALYKFGAGFNATHEMSWTEAGGCDRFRLEVNFENATVWIRAPQSLIWINRGATGEQGGWHAIDLDLEPLGREHHQHWLDIVRGRMPPDDTGLSGLSSIVVAESVYRSSLEGRILSVPDRS